MSTSSLATAGQNATATQYNDLRTDAIRRDSIFQFEVEDTLAVLDDQGGSYIMPFAFTIYKIKVWCETGTCTIRIKKQTGNVLATQAVSSTATDVTTGFTTTALAENDILSMDIIGTSSGVHVIAQVFATRNL